MTSNIKIMEKINFPKAKYAIEYDDGTCSKTTFDTMEEAQNALKYLPSILKRSVGVCAVMF